MKKKLLSLALALALCLGLTVPALADDSLGFDEDAVPLKPGEGSAYIIDAEAHDVQNDYGWSRIQRAILTNDPPDDATPTETPSETPTETPSETPSGNLTTEAFIDMLENPVFRNVIVLAITQGTVNGDPTLNKPTFTDVAEDSPFKDAIAWAVEQNITKGTSATTFGPGNTCTHNHILTFLWRAGGSPAAEGSSDFEKAIAWAKSKGLAETIDGGAACTRAQTMMYLWKLAGSPKTEANATFTDVPADAEYAQAVAWAVAQGVTKGISATTFGPDNTCTRGQIVTFLYRNLAK